MKREQAVLRARSAIGHGAIYVLGAGGKNPHAAEPWDIPGMGCDCSGLAAWALGLSRFIWLDTSRIYAIARGERAFTEVKWTEARPGDLLVYPDRLGTDQKRHQGHVGLVSEASGTGPIMVVHCSSGNFQRHSDAIQETGPEAWTARGIVARPAVLED